MTSTTGPVQRTTASTTTQHRRLCPAAGRGPLRVTRDEGIELANRHGAAAAGAFVNGVLERAVGERGISKPE